MRAGLYAVKVGSEVLGGITSQDIVAESELGGDPSSGEIYRRILYMMRRGYSPTFSTLALATALGATGGLGTDMSGLSGGLILYAQKHEDGASRATGSVHRSFTFDKGILYPQTLSCDHRGDASLSYGVTVSSSDGDTSPITIGNNVSLPTLAAQAERFSLGGISIGGVSLTNEDELQSVQISFGIETAVGGGGSKIYDRFANIGTIMPSITLTGQNPEWVDDTLIPLLGKAATHANTTIYFRKRLSGSSFYSDGSAVHLKITAAGLSVPESLFSASGTAYGTTSVRLDCVYDGTYAPLVFDTASTIT